MKYKIKRTLTSMLAVDENRTGNCSECGACCKLPVRCVFLKTEEDGKEQCSIYTIRPPNCRKFPRTVEEYSLVEKICTYEFSKTILAAPEQ